MGDALNLVKVGETDGMTWAEYDDPLYQEGTPIPAKPEPTADVRLTKTYWNGVLTGLQFSRLPEFRGIEEKVRTYAFGKTRAATSLTFSLTQTEAMMVQNFLDFRKRVVAENVAAKRAGQPQPYVGAFQIDYEAGQRLARLVAPDMCAECGDDLAGYHMATVNDRPICETCDPLAPSKGPRASLFDGTIVDRTGSVVPNDVITDAIRDGMTS